MFEIPAIDVHGHYGQYDRGPEAVEANRFMSGSGKEVADRALQANIVWTIVSPLKALMPRGHGDAFAGNREAAAVVSEVDRLLQYVVIDPNDERTFEQADKMLQHPKCVGIKIHPEEHCYPIVKHGKKIFEFAAERRAVVLTHTSEANSCTFDFVPFANDYPEVQLILAHIGCSSNRNLTDQVRAIQKCRFQNVFADTSSAMSVTPHLIEWAVSEVGADRVLFGTDTPLYFSPMQRARIEFANLSDEQKQLVLRDNAIRIFQQSGRSIGEELCQKAHCH